MWVASHAGSVRSAFVPVQYCGASTPLFSTSTPPKTPPVQRSSRVPVKLAVAAEGPVRCPSTEASAPGSLAMVNVNVSGAVTVIVNVPLYCSG